jgi:hypothetical protein
MVGLFVGGALVTLAQYLRTRERRLLPIAALLAFGAAALGEEDYTRSRRWQAAAGACALLVVAMLSPHHRPVTPPARGEGGRP